jgi:hypothetical protein
MPLKFYILQPINEISYKNITIVKKLIICIADYFTLSVYGVGPSPANLHRKTPAGDCDNSHSQRPVIGQQQPEID